MSDEIHLNVTADGPVFETLEGYAEEMYDDGREGFAIAVGDNLFLHIKPSGA